MTWKNKALLVGVIVGALAGLGSALLYIRSVEDAGVEEPERIGTGDALKLGIALFGLIKQISSLAD
ncbi:MAG: hypothetical protein PVF45_02650 [Anaerolineae bacterium]|jgi:hypothetical protein